MIEILTGVPGSGKTYKAMYVLFCNFAKDKKIIKDNKFIVKGIKNALTNINELDLTKFENVDSLNWEKFYNDITSLYNFHKQNNSDTELKEFASKLDLLHTLIILDECHNYFDSQDKVLVWWLSYHRHLYQEVYLITQNLSLVNAKYKAFSEFFYKAIPSSLKIFKSMKYNQYTNARLSLNSKSNVIKLPIVNEVFETYSSGKNSDSKSIIKKFFMLAIVLIILVISIFKFAFGAETIEEQIKEAVTEVETPVDNNPFRKPEPLESKKFKKEKKFYIKITCSQKLQICNYNSKSFTKKLIDNMTEMFDYKVLAFADIPYTEYSNYYLEVDSKFYYMFNEVSKKSNNKVIKDEKVTFNNADSKTVISK